MSSLSENNGGYEQFMLDTKKEREEQGGSILDGLITTTVERVDPPGTPILQCLADVEPEEISWLWNNRIPIGKITMLDGDPGLGKSWCAYAIAASVTTGKPLPGDNRENKPSNVLILTGEDDPADTIRPRMDSIGANPKLVQMLPAVIGDDGKERHVSLVKDLGALEIALVEKDHSLVIIDPLNAYLGGGVDTYNDADIRTVLAPISKLASKHKVAILCIRHLTKTKGGSALYRGQGSIAYIAAARMALLVAKHPDNPNIRVIAGVKTNITGKSKSMSFEIDDQGMFYWRGEVDIDADTLLQATSENQKDSTLQDAEQFLFDLLWDTPMSAKEVFSQGEDAGFSRRTLERAKKSMKVLSKRNGKSWAWQLSNNANDSRDDAWRSLVENSPNSSDG
jgi:RecA-family ATPase